MNYAHTLASGQNHHRNGGEREYALPRWAVWKRLHAEGIYSLKSIGGVEGYDHTTVMYGIRELGRGESTPSGNH